ncbi:NAD-dependent epimerase/dehydratase family protein [Bifidobacterium amazonense]|uniref:NAD-dependent epimerase/dehydratase family protein n=1 Tax=Bifidobacterium amazonense TaxID=2809027 RepID=A0ABS9VUK3_9BIFI|nr:NAD-dependent epimerase/dehydratase family protein [Bifidobacterium amazonense]MCH9275495.1 NAD-dependent epimerase/dehydratase family protein [Bifidobacterium amazonense]
MTDLNAEYAALANETDIDWACLRGAHVLVTGATGLIGSLCARTLLERNRSHDAGIIVEALVRDTDKARAVFDGYGERDGLRLVQGSLDDVDGMDVPADYIIHAACPTASRFFMSHPVETFAAIVDGTRSMLELARRSRSRSFVYVSSMEVYGMGNAEPGVDHPLREENVGYIDPCQVRSCYSEGKRAAENLCVSYASEYGVPVKTVRLAQTFGPGIPRDDVRLFAALARNAVAGQDFVMKTTGESTRMYAYTADAVSAILTVLLGGEDGVSYNVANPSTYSSIRDMADMVYERFGTGDARVVVDVDPDAPYPPQHHLPLDVSRLEALGWRPRVGLEEMYRRLIGYLR